MPRKRKFTRTRWLEATYRTIPRGTTFVRREEERLARGEVRDILRETVQAWLDKRIDPIEVSPPNRGLNCAADRTYRWGERIEPDGKKRKTVTHRPMEEPLAMKHILAAKYRTRTMDGEELDEDEQPVKPWVRVILCEGSWACLPAVLPRGKKPEDLDDGYDVDEDPEIVPFEGSVKKKKKKVTKKKKTKKVTDDED
jgi:hypothetical protein